MLSSISGSQGTGKSTLLDALPYKKITRKTSRSILTDWNVTLSQVNNDRDLTVKFQDEILNRKLDDEADAVASSDLYLTERTFADLFVYALVAIGKDNEYSDWLDQYYQKCVAAQSRYDNVFFLTAGHFQPVNDGVRAVNQHYSRMVDMLMLEYTLRMGSEMVEINDPSIQTRVSIVQSYLTQQL